MKFAHRKIITAILSFIMLLCVSGNGFNVLTTAYSEPYALNDSVLRLSATAYINPASIVITWQNLVLRLGSLTGQKSEMNNWVYKIHRRDFSSKIKEIDWYLIATTGARKFIDSNVKVGTRYEYKVEVNTYSEPTINGIANDTTILNGRGYKSPGIRGFISTGIELPVEDYKGKVILIVDSTYSTSLASKISRLEQDLIGDSWGIVRHNVNRTDSVASVKQLIVNDYNNDPNVKCVFLLGHIPVPYSGTTVFPDGHPEHKGAWPADAFYGDIDGKWTDSKPAAKSAESIRNHNYPGDGKYDQSFIPIGDETQSDSIELYVGRVDLTDLPAFAKTDTELIGQYLDKDHNYRHGITKVNRKAVLADNMSYKKAFNSSDIIQSTANGYINFSPFFGTDTNSNINLYNYFEETKTTNYMWSNIAAPGGYTSVGSVTTDLIAKMDPKVVFNMFFGSYSGDWDSTNNILRASTATSMGLAAVWGDRPGWVMHDAGLNDPLGSSQLKTINNQKSVYSTTNDYTDPVRQEINDSEYNFGYFLDANTMVGFLGDPTLKMFNVEPPSKVNSNKEGSIAKITWQASPASNVIGYNIYRSASKDGPFVRISNSPVITTNYNDTLADGGIQYYMVKTYKLEKSSSGTFYNTSNGIITSVDMGIKQDKTAPNFTDKAINVSSTQNGKLRISWNSATDNQKVKEYKVYMNGSLSKTTSDPGCVLTGIQPLANCTIGIKAVDISGNISESINRTIVFPSSSKPGFTNSISIQKIDPYTVKINWQHPTSASPIAKYIIELEVFNQYVIIQKPILEGNITSFVFNNLHAGKSYSYRLYSVDNNGSSGYIHGTFATDAGPVKYPQMPLAKQVVADPKNPAGTLSGKQFDNLYASHSQYSSLTTSGEHIISGNKESQVSFDSVIDDSDSNSTDRSDINSRSSLDGHLNSNLSTDMTKTSGGINFKIFLIIIVLFLFIAISIMAAIKLYTTRLTKNN